MLEFRMAHLSSLHVSIQKATRNWHLGERSVPFIITDAMKAFYYRGLRNREREQGWLRDTF